MGIIGIIMILLFAFIAYIAVRLVGWLATWTHPAVRVLAVVVYAALTLSIFLLIWSFKGEWADIGRAIGAYWLGIFLYLALSVVLVDIIYLIVRLITRPDKRKRKKMRFVAGWIVVCLTACVSIYGFWHADNPVVAHYDIDISANHSEAANANSGQGMLHAVLVSDTHIGAQGTEGRLPRIVELINAQKPDIVFIAGDVFNNDFSAVESPEAVVEAFKQIEAPLGVYACLGNHDCGNGFDRMLEEIEQGNITLLREDYTIVDERFIVVGRQDGSAISRTDGLARESYEAIAERIGDADLPVIVIDHNPGRFDEYGEDVSLVLSGHTHDGQVFPLTLVTDAMYVCDYGVYQRDAQSPVLLVTSGVGYWGPPMRVGSDSEIVVLDLTL